MTPEQLIEINYLEQTYGAEVAENYRRLISSPDYRKPPRRNLGNRRTTNLFIPGRPGRRRKNNPPCPKCDGETLSQGKTANNRRRYLCDNCGKYHSVAEEIINELSIVD
jgi:hypothetical protein